MSANGHIRVYSVKELKCNNTRISLFYIHYPDAQFDYIHIDIVEFSIKNTTQIYPSLHTVASNPIRTIQSGRKVH